MKGRTLVILIILIVIVTVGIVSYLMLAEINSQKEENRLKESKSSQEESPNYLVYLEK